MGRLSSWKPGEDIFSGHHTFICGASQQGKTTFAIKRLNKLKKPMLFFNPQQVRLGQGWVRADSRSSWEQIHESLRTGHRIDYRPARKNNRASCELAVIIENLFESGWSINKNMLLVVDECHLAKYHDSGDEAMETVATRGLFYGIHCVFIVQRPAYAHKAAYTQSDLHIMFRTNMEKGYFSGKGIPYESYNKMVNEGGQYSYVVFDGLSMLGPFKE